MFWGLGCRSVKFSDLRLKVPALLFRDYGGALVQVYTFRLWGLATGRPRE